MDISATLEPFLEDPLDPLQLKQISMYIDLLLRWNARMNLTAIRKPEAIVSRHFGESFFLARHVFPFKSGDQSAIAPERALGPSTEAPPRVIDLGSGAGFPALPLKIWNPAIDLVLIESNHRKAAFLREVARALRLTNINVIAERAEAVTGRVGTELPPADIVTFRAVERFDHVLSIAAAFLSAHSSLAVLIGEAQASTLKAGLPGLICRTIPVPASHSRVLAICIPRLSGTVDT